jgi:hypothetical protein
MIISVQCGLELVTFHGNPTRNFGDKKCAVPIWSTAVSIIWEQEDGLERTHIRSQFRKDNRSMKHGR